MSPTVTAVKNWGGAAATGKPRSHTYQGDRKNVLKNSQSAATSAK